MKKFLVISIIFLFTLAAFGNGVSLNSPGTRAISMAGAYTSQVGDYSAPYWNPAGLMNVEGAQLSFFITDLIPMATYKRDDLGIDAKAITHHYLAPNASFLWSCKLYDKMHMGLSVIVPAGLGVEWEGDDFVAFAGPDSVTHPVYGTFSNVFTGSTFDWESSIAVMDISLSLAHKIGDKMNIGAGFHLLNGSMTMKRGVDAFTIIPAPDPGSDTMLDTQYEEESDGWGYGVSFGLQYMFTEKLAFGASLRSRMKVGFEGDASLKNNTVQLDSTYSFDRDISWPLWIGGGFSYMVTDNFMLALEGTWSQWSETENVLVAKNENGTESELTLLWEDALQIRLGGEYWLNDQWALRAGFYIDPAPGPAKTQTILIPQADYNVITTGVGYKLEKWSFDLALEYLMGKDVELDAADAEPGVGMTGTHGINIIVPSFAVTYKFK